MLRSITRSLKIKLLLGLIATVAIPVCIVFVMTSMNIERLSLESFTRTASGQLLQVENAMTIFFQEAEFTAGHIAGNPVMMDIDATISSYLQDSSDSPPTPKEGDAIGRRIWDFLRPIQKSRPYLTAVYVGTASGGFIKAADTPIKGGYDPRARPWYKEALKSPAAATVSKAYVSTNGDPTITVARPLLGRDGQILAIAGMDISLRDLTNMVKNSRIGRTGYVMFIENGGTILADPKDQAHNFKKIADLQDESLARIYALQSGSLAYSRNGTDYLAYVHTFAGSGHKLVGIIERAEVMEPVYQAVTQLALITLASLLLIAGALWFFLDRNVAKPLGGVVDFLKAISAKQFQRRALSGRTDEIGLIYSELNATAETLERNIEEISRKSQEAEDKALAAEKALEEADRARRQADAARAEGMDHAARRLEGVVHGISHATDMLAAMSRSIRDGASEQTGRIQTTATAMEEMTATIMEVARSSGTAAESGQDARRMVTAGSDIVQKSIQAMQTTNSHTAILKRSMAQLDTQAGAIGSLVTVIEDIADQTNLLALNAAIEAARAGDAGRGFAVVADEVRKLAEKTMQATKQVGETIHGIQSTAAENVSSIDKALADLDTASDLVNSSGSVLGEIMSRVEHAADQIQAIATSAEQQSAASEEINSSIATVNRITVETTHEVARSTEALHELGEQVRALAVIIQELKADSATRA